MKIFYISPHYDDAVGSCGARMSREKMENEVSLITVFSEVKKPFSEYANMLHAYWNLNDPLSDRKNENINVCKFLGINNIMLGFLDSIYRTFDNEYIYPTQESIFSKVSPLDFGLIENIKNEILHYITKEDLIFFPLGVGSHVDHVIVSEVGKLLKKENYKVSFYLDFYYTGKLPEICELLNERKIRFDSNYTNEKINAVKLYKSQVQMLYGDESKIAEYYNNKLKGVEIYYE
jgi:N-acetylglucosaminylphosphatidylinositol deacetylase family protein